MEVAYIYTLDVKSVLQVWVAIFMQQKHKPSFLMH